MRRPALHRPAPRAGWSHPYPAGVFSPVFYNDGGQPPAPAPAGVPATFQAPPAPAPAPAAPAPAQGPGQGDDDHKVTLTQDRLTVMMTREKDEGRRAALRQIAEAAGLDPETFDPTSFGELFQEAEKARKAQLSEQERRAEDLATREQALADREEAAKRREAEAARRDRDSQVRAALVRLGATGDDLDDAAALIRIDDQADAAAITTAADALKTRRPELFGAPAPGVLPPAPHGGPAGGPPPRTPVAGTDAVNEAAMKRAEAMGLRHRPAA
jgi:hypothetical protein